MTRFATSETVEGIRLYGSTDLSGRTLRPELMPDLGAPGVPELPVMWLGFGDGSDHFMVWGPECLLIEFENEPGVTYLAWAILEGEIPMIQVSPVEVRSTDGSEIPGPAARNPAAVVTPGSGHPLSHGQAPLASTACHDIDGEP